MDTVIVIAALGVIYLTVIAKQGAATSMICVNSSSSEVQVPLTCSSNEMIHVITESYSKESSQATCLTTSNNCSKASSVDTEGLVVNCNGKQTCAETLSAPSNCTPLAAYKIIYECVEGSIDICIAVNKSRYGSVYLHSPGFPGSVGVNESCHCEVTGSLMRVTAVEHRAQQGAVTLSTDKETWSSNSSNYNLIIAQLAGLVLLNYDNHNRNDSDVWMKVADTGTMNVRCWKGNDSLTTADNGPTPTSSPETHHHTTLLESTNTNIKTQSSTGPADTTTLSSSSFTSATQSSSSVPVIVGSGAAGGVLLAVIVVVIVLLYRRVNNLNDRNTLEERLNQRTGICEPNNQGRIYFERDSYFVNEKDGTESSTDAASSVPPGSEVSPQTDISHPLPEEPGEASKPKRMMQDKNVDDRGEGIFVNGDTGTVSSADTSSSIPPGSEVNPQTDMEVMRYISHPLSKEHGEASKPKRMMQDKNVDDRGEGIFVNGDTGTVSSADTSSSISPGSEVNPQTDMEVMRYISHPLSKEHDEASKSQRMLQAKHAADRGEGMFVNDLYHSFKPDPIYEVRGEEHKSVGSGEGNPQAQMSDNDLYDHIVKSQKDCVREEPVFRNYEEIKDENLCVSQEAKRSVCIHRPSVYDELKLHTQKDWIKAEHAVGNYEEIMNENVCVSKESKRSIHMQRPSAYDELKLHTQKEWTSEKPAVGNYDTIEDKDLCVSPEEKRFIPIQRPSAYDELELHTQKDFIREEHADGNYDKIKNKDLCVSPEGKRSIFKQRSSAYDELKLHTQKD